MLRFKNKTAPLLLVLFALFGLTACVEPPQVERAIHPLPEDAFVTDAPLGRYGGIFVLNETRNPRLLIPKYQTTSLPVFCSLDYSHLWLLSTRPRRLMSLRWRDLGKLVRTTSPTPFTSAVVCFGVTAVPLRQTM